MIEATARLALPLLASGQAQKELVHNEALGAIDVLVQAAVESVLAAPPPSPTPGQCWIVGDGATGAWSGHAGSIACWTAGGWRFVSPAEGTRCWVASAAVWAEWVAGAWRIGVLAGGEVRIGGLKVIGAQGSVIDAPTGGATVDAEARASIAAILSALRAHGLIAS